MQRIKRIRHDGERRNRALAHCTNCGCLQTRQWLGASVRCERCHAANCLTRRIPAIGSTKSKLLRGLKMVTAISAAHVPSSGAIAVADRQPQATWTSGSGDAPKAVSEQATLATGSEVTPSRS